MTTATYEELQQLKAFPILGGDPFPERMGLKIGNDVGIIAVHLRENIYGVHAATDINDKPYHVERDDSEVLSDHNTLSALINFLTTLPIEN